MNKIKNTILILGIALSFCFASMPSFVGASSALNAACNSGSASALCDEQNDTLESHIKPIVNTLFYILGAVAVLMIIYAGIMYTISAGDAGQVKKAKDTLLYAVVGLVVALLAYAIVNFVIGKF